MRLYSVQRPCLPAGSRGRCPAWRAGRCSAAASPQADAIPPLSELGETAVRVQDLRLSFKTPAATKEVSWALQRAQRCSAADWPQAARPSRPPQLASLCAPEPLASSTKQHRPHQNLARLPALRRCYRA